MKRQGRWGELDTLLQRGHLGGKKAGGASAGGGITSRGKGVDSITGFQQNG